MYVVYSVVFCYSSQNELRHCIISIGLYSSSLILSFGTSNLPLNPYNEFVIQIIFSNSSISI